MLRSKRYHYCRELRPLRLVDGDRISQGDFIQFAEIALHYPVMETDSNLLLDQVDPLDDPYAPVECVLVVVVLRLDDLVHFT